MGHHRGRRLGIGIADRFTAPISMPALDISKLPTGAGISANEPRLIEGQHVFLRTHKRVLDRMRPALCTLIGLRFGGLALAQIPFVNQGLSLSVHLFGRRKVQEMSGNIASAKINGTEPSTPVGATAVPTGYRVSLVPGALEVSARLVTAEELRNLVKILRASVVILEDAVEGDAGQPLNLTQRVAEVSTSPRK
jgi:hypothetical protein